MKDNTHIIKKAYGSEPSWSADSTLSNEERDSALQRAMSWYWNRKSKRESKKWVLDYCKHTKMDAEVVKAISQNGIKTYTEIGYLCRMSTRGAPLDDKTVVHLRDALKELQMSGSNAISKRESSNLPSIQERVDNKYREYLGDLDVHIDSTIDLCLKKKKEYKFDAVRWVTSKGIKPMHCTKIAAYIEASYLLEMVNAFKGKDEQLVEGYSYLTKPSFKKVIQLLSETATLLKVIADEQKSARKPRKKKHKTPNQLTSKVKYMVESKEYGIVSVSPEKIINAATLVVFNEKYRILSVYHAADPRGLSMKGTTVQNFSLEKSFSKKLRNPKDILSKLTGVRAIQTVTDTIKTKPVITTGRINENCILIGAY